MKDILMRGSVAVLILAMATVLAGCAKPPHKIEPAIVDPAPLRSMSCDDLERLGQQIEAELRDASAKQQKAADEDARGVFWVGVPTASAGGDDIEEEVAQLKGKQIAIRQVLGEQCGPDAAGTGEAAPGELESGESEPDAPASGEGESKGAPESDAVDSDDVQG